MHYTPPQRIFDLFRDENTASTQGRAAFLDWMKSAGIVPGDTITIPDVNGNHIVWEKNDFGVQERN